MILQKFYEKGENRLFEQQPEKTLILISFFVLGSGWGHSRGARKNCAAA